MHRRIRHHFLADLHVTRCAWSKGVSGIFLNKPCRVELVTSPNRDYRPYAISENSFFIYHLYWEFTDGFVQGKPNIDEYFWIRSSAEVRNDTESAWIIVEGPRSWKLDFPKICNLFHRFSKKRVTITCLIIILIQFFCYFGKGRRFLPPGAYAFLASFLHIPLVTVFNQIW